MGGEWKVELLLKEENGTATELLMGWRMEQLAPLLGRVHGMARATAADDEEWNILSHW